MLYSANEVRGLLRSIRSRKRSRTVEIGLIIALFVLPFFVGIYFFTRDPVKKSLNPVAKQITLDELEATLKRLEAGAFEHGFFGITSDGIDCLYFMRYEGGIAIDFEVTRAAQQPFAAEIEEFAKAEGFRMSETTYGNPGDHVGTEPAPVYRIEFDGSVTTASAIGREIMTLIFGRYDDNRFDVVP